MNDTPIYAVGDIHGQLEMLETALDLISTDGGRDARIVFLGDLVDRGASSKQVIERLMAGQESGLNWTVLSGNHDDLFSGFIEHGINMDPRVLSGVPWTGPLIGGLATLASYGMSELDRPVEQLLAEARATVPIEHRNFLRGLPTYLAQDDLLFVHAGIRPGVPLIEQDRDDLMWIRSDFLEDTRAHPWLVVHGHTAVQTPEHHGNRVNLDSGAGYGRPITAAVFEHGQVWQLTPSGRSLLAPADL